MAKNKKTLRVAAISNQIYYCEPYADGTMSLDDRVDMTSDAVKAVAEHLHGIQDRKFDGKVGKGLAFGFPDETKIMTLIPESKWEEVKKIVWGEDA